MPSCVWQEDGVVAMQRLQVGQGHTTTAVDIDVAQLIQAYSCEAMCVCVCVCACACEVVVVLNISCFLRPGQDC